MPPPVLGEVGGFSFFWISGRGQPPVGFGGRGDFVSRLGAGGGGGDGLSGTHGGTRARVTSAIGVLLRLRRPRALGRRASLWISREEEGAGRSTQRQGKGASASATLLCICSVVLIYLDLR